MTNLALSQTPHSPLTPAAIGRAATLALYDELSLAPKPGLVTLIDSGSHDDMDAHTFMRSLFSLRRYFAQIAEAGFGGADFAVLERYGIAAEARMFAATGGVNTHRGAIFMLGLLCAAAGAALREHGGALQPDQLRGALRQHWGSALAKRSQRPPVLPGGIAARRHGLRGASEEAALAFPVLFETALPALKGALARGLSLRQARLDTLFHIIAVLDDSNLAHRGGLAGLRCAQRAAKDFLDRGGIARPDGLRAAQAVADDFVRQRLSPGGAADTLAAACWFQRVCPAS
ncbi:triphosphoribosyl-dephospho-CoA synthase MdcB [Variovorax sp. Root318D1]|uniref:triphosphoribosyl-dephospho-CoA synthase MdcB n=1 Tax=Variovorax sp. Root318D1 TaxID=1736513 RepID=UPI0006F37F91|nr:triphosphoribosyl-dephospho-CoA synthase MdcB [Variovorax sp. Root318D1]KQU91594.1 triphosphoribosyl-dephospho-CoA synthase MdcB [Variovorax sp. Root318D1]